jgi:peroxiredoxin
MASASELTGCEAQDFRLPTADNREVALSDCLSHGPAVVWFSRGLGCPMCRRHRAHLTMGYPTLRDLNAEVLEVTPTPVERAAFYFSNYSLAFPYLCDPSRETARAYGLEQLPITMWDQAKGMMRDPLDVPNLMREVRQGPNPAPEELAGWSSDDGFFIIDQKGTIRLARAGRMAGLPSRAEIEQTLREIRA